MGFTYVKGRCRSYLESMNVYCDLKQRHPGDHKITIFWSASRKVRR